MGAAVTGGPVTTTMVLEGLWKIHDDTLDGLVPHAITFVKGQPAPPVKCAFVAQIASGKWTAPIALNEICRP